ncbi:TonB-dependent receptor [Subsaxibacter sp. CAU 1640]|uniref:carboxypeptidase-like regulatory domain-containing protein n=1 Tax=Subsaxibacter sp. CAU 1640 TaxID=2933271 RepID=UPI002002DAE9|nr:carboxypeptidase-like regulatory domain-containing protein [Subsaxibacter sp. CAU 1640]MCK7589418.1 TonB-dependent receptor [Subsaxibacter sp. CAU 1640]
MRHQLSKTIFFIFLTLTSTYAFCQEGIVSGVLNSDTDGFPLPGVNVIIKGTTKGTQTDFDGFYSIKCQVGDVLVFSFVGMQNKEVKVTKNMFSEISNNFSVQKNAVEPIQNDAYKKALKTYKDTLHFIPTMEGSERTYNKKNYFEYNRIKSIKVKPNEVVLDYFNRDLHYEVGYISTTALQFIKNSNLPKLQSTFSQGASQNGELTFLGPETGNVFSYGPKIASLEFDDSAYTFDNNILETSLKTFNTMFFNVSTDNLLVGLNISHKTNEDVFGRERSKSNDITLNFNNKDYQTSKLEWDAFLKYSNKTDNQPNINGFQNNVLLNTWITPPSFENSQGAVLDNGSQRSFSPNNYNNPRWLLENNRNSESYDYLIGSVQNKIDLGDFNLESNLNYNHSKNEQHFGLVTQTVGFEDGYLSEKDIQKNNLNGLIKFDFENRKNDYELKINSIVNYTFEDLRYRLKESSGFEDFSFSSPENSTSVSHQMNRNTFRLLNQFSFEWNDVNSEITFGNNSYLSSLQKNEWFLPSIQLRLNLDDIFNMYDINHFNLTTSTSFDINDMPLFYTNQSHNSLLLTPSQSLTYTANNDLFLSDALQLEKKQSYSIGASIGFRLFDTYFEFDANYFETETKGSVFPINNGEQFSLENVANIRNRGFEMSLENSFYTSNEFQISSKIVFATNRTKVLKLLVPEERVAIAGFATISKNLIVGQPAGIIMGSSYARDAQNNMIIDETGFPIVSNEQQIIGDPTPNFTFGFSNQLKWKRFKLNFVLDYQNGGDVWNGTQNVLNYFGTSQQSAEQRTITNFVFQGVNQQGDTNTTSVDFYNPSNGMESNRFVKYGFDGVAEDAIEDASYLNLKTIDVSYSFVGTNPKGFFRQFDVGMYAHNLFTVSQFRGASPYSSLYDSHSGQGLNFFNAPMATEIGLTITLKI